MLKKIFDRYPELLPIHQDMKDALELLYESISAGHKIMTCGNGGSAADAEHIVGELMKGFLLERPLSKEQSLLIEQNFPNEAGTIIHSLQQGIPAISLVSGVALPTAFANDVSSEFVFAQQAFVLGKKGDVLWGISTSGNSANVLQAFKIAQAFGIKTLGLTGRDGGSMAEFCDVEIRVPAISTPEIQELHLPIYHALCAALEDMLFGDCKPLNCSRSFKLPFKPELIIFDFDGIMTDNTVFVSENGQEMVRCSREDSLGLSILQKTGQAMLILSTETNPVVAQRAKKLGIQYSQGCTNKRDYLNSYFLKHAIDPQKVFYMGNDINDKEAMELVGCVVCPNDAHNSIRPLAHILLQKKGGHGAVREICDMIMTEYFNA